MSYKMYSIVNQVLQSQTVIFRHDTNTSFFLNTDNTDYQAFKKDLVNGAELQDATGNVMTSQAVTEFLQGLQ